MHECTRARYHSAVEGEATSGPLVQRSPTATGTAAATAVDVEL